MIQAVTLSKLKDVLMSPKAGGIKEPYFIIRGESGQNITILTPGKSGEEYNKTYGYFHSHQGIEIFHIVYGQGVLAMQRNDENGEAKEFRVVSLRPGMTVEVPIGYGHVLINIGKTYLVAIDDSPEVNWRDIEPVRIKRGLAYYLVEKKGEVGFEPNPHYTLHPQVSTY